ncbi:MAG: CAP domain-containing protein, partial [Myxococcales bacterium]
HNTGRGQRGENIAASAPAGRWAPADVVAAWASEAADYDYAANTCAEGKQCGHYTQLVWRATTRAGCAHKLCTVNWPFAPAPPGSWDFWVCDYEPPGNFVGQRPY